MIHCLDDFLCQNEEDSLSYRKDEVDYNISLDPNLAYKYDENKIFNEIKKVLPFNEPCYDCESINAKEHYFINKKKIIDLNNNKLKINETSSQTNSLMIKVKIIKRGRKLKMSDEIGNHNNKTFDNLLKRIKHSLLKGLRVFINIKIKEVYKDDKKLSSLELLTLTQEQANNSKIAFNKIFIHKSIKEIFSEQLSTKYKSKKDNLYNHNEEVIKKLLPKKDIEKRNIFENILNLKFIDVVNYVIGKRNDLTQLYGLKLAENLSASLSIDEEYSNVIYYTMKNLEKILNEKKSRNRSKKNEINK